MPFLSANRTKKRREFMAVEARHMGFFSQQLADNRDNRMEATSMDDYYNLLQIRYGMPVSATDAVDNSAFIPMYSSGVSDYLPPRTPLKSDSGVTYNVPAGSRKRSRESPSGLFPYSTVDAEGIQRDAACCGSSFSFLGEDISHQIQQQQLDVDRIIAQHTEKVRLDIEEKRRNQARRILEAIEQRLMKRLRTKDEEIQKMVKFNYALEERIESLSVENQIWRNLAQTNEATANALRTKLEQVLAHVKDDHTAAMDNYAVAENPLMDDALSCCDSCSGDERPEHVESSQRAEEVESAAARDRRFCRNCGKGEARVLLLPCRHLCLCGVCGSSVHTCPVCKAAKTASVHVNVS